MVSLAFFRAPFTKVMTMDLHADPDFFEKPVDHLFASTIFLPYVKV
jgi:ribose-phosphate pyrophosphokinase